MTTKINSFKLDKRSDYKLTVKYKDKDYPLNFESAAFDDCFESRLSGYKNAKAAYRDSQTAENERVMIDLLNKEDNFLKVIALFLESRFELGRKEIAYNLSIRHADADYNSRLYTDDKVYRFGNCQICEDILKRWFLKSFSNSGENDFSLTFNHSLNQREPVSFMVSRPALERIMSGTIDYEKLIEQINGDASRLQFSIACDLVNQSFKSKNLPEPITEQNWNEFYSDPKGFVTSSFNMPA